MATTPERYGELSTGGILYIEEVSGNSLKKIMTKRWNPAIHCNVP
jgi:hypothetical protein